METLTCTACGQDWQRERVRGRKPKLCPDCKSGDTRPTADQPKRTTLAAVSAPARPEGDTTPRAPNDAPDASSRALLALPFTKRTSGWCTDYPLGPAAQHDKCDGDLGRYRCPCDCHEWDAA